MRPHAGVRASTPGSEPRSARGGRIPGLDGLRAVAVAGVVLYHLGYEWIPGGFLGVDIFFVISGFLITTLLLREVYAHGRIAFGAFYLRRARRLLPALFLVLAAVLVLAATIAPDTARAVLRDTPAALVYVSNWWSIGQEQSYFELIGRGNMLAHLWSLAVEEQFYLVWPAVLGLTCWVAPRLGVGRRRAVLVVALVGAVASTLRMAWLSVGAGYPLDADPTRVYFGTDTHAMSVLVGAALAAVWQPLAYRARVAAGARAILAGAGLLAAAGTAYLLLTVSEYTPWLYRGGFLVVALVVALLVAAATHPASPLGGWLDVAPVRWVGERSYGIYLWHWPILLVTRPGQDLPWEGWWVDVARLALVLLVAEASYRFVEVPVRQGAIGRAVARWRERANERGAAAALLPGSALGLARAVAVVVAVAAVTASITAPSTLAAADGDARLGPTTSIADDTAAPAGVAPITAPAPRAAGSPGTTSRSSSAPSARATARASSSAKPAAAPSTSAAAPSTGRLSTADVSWFGDSVTLWSADVLRAELPGVALDAGINRSPGFIEGRVTAALSAGTLRKVVVMHLGDAGPVDPDALDRTLTTLSDRARVVLVNSTARFAWVPSSNATLRDVARNHPNVVVADWKSYSAGHTSWFIDGLHLSAAGKPYFARFVRKAVLGG